MSRFAIANRSVLASSICLSAFSPILAQQLAVIKRPLNDPVKVASSPRTPRRLPVLIRAKGVADLLKPVTIYYPRVDTADDKGAREEKPVQPKILRSDPPVVTIYYPGYPSKPVSQSKTVDEKNKTLTKAPRPVQQPLASVPTIGAASASQHFNKSPITRVAGIAVSERPNSTVAVQDPPAAAEAESPAPNGSAESLKIGKPARPDIEPRANAAPVEVREVAEAKVEEKVIVPNDRPALPEPDSTLERDALPATEAKDPVAMNNRAVQLAKETKYDEAAVLLESAVREAPQFARLHQNLSAVYEHMKRNDDALAAAREAAALAPSEPAVLNQLCGLEVMAGNDAVAVECFGKLKGIQQLDADGLTYYGVALLRSGQLAGAVEALEKATEVPASAGPLNALGVAYFNNKQYAESARAFKRAVELDPDHARLRLNLGIAQVANQNREGALSQYRMLKESHPDLARVLYRVLYRDKVVFVGDLQPAAALGSRTNNER